MECFEAFRALTGVCIERKIDLGNAVLAVLVSIFLTYRQLKESRAAQLLQANAMRARFVLDLNQELLASDAERIFFDKIDYKDFHFDPDKFGQSPEELQLDRLLYKLSYVGKLLRDGLVRWPKRCEQCRRPHQNSGPWKYCRAIKSACHNELRYSFGTTLQ